MDDIEKVYFEWLCNKLQDASVLLNYQKLLVYLFNVPFMYTIPIDNNRAIDGIDLRYRFSCEEQFATLDIMQTFENKKCSMLEMMLALALNCDEHIMYDKDLGNRVGFWFFDMIKSLGLDTVTDEHFDTRYISIILNRFYSNDYTYTGKGGLFTVECPRQDMRETEIWYQMCWYLNDFIKKGEK